MVPRSVIVVCSFVVMASVSGAASAQTFPRKPIRIVAGLAGSSNDFTARQVAQGISGPLGQPIIVDNRSTVLIAAEIVARAQPDGYTLAAAGSQFMTVALLQKTNYDPVKDFTGISMLGIAPLFLVVHPSVPVQSVKELIALAKAKPGELNYGSSGIGSATHLSGELFKAMAGVNIVHIPYKSGALVLQDVLAGRVQITLDGSSLVPYIRSGKLRALAVTSARPTPLFPELPTVAASGLPGYESGSIYALFAPTQTPAPTVNRLNQEVVRMLRRTDVKESFFNAGIEVVESTPAELNTKIKNDMATLGKLIKDIGIRAE